MANPDFALAVLKQINKAFAKFLSEKGSVSEADTRAELIDKIFIPGAQA